MPQVKTVSKKIVTTDALDVRSVELAAGVHAYKAIRSRTIDPGGNAKPTVVEQEAKGLCSGKGLRDLLAGKVQAPPAPRMGEYTVAMAYKPEFLDAYREVGYCNLGHGVDPKGVYDPSLQILDPVAAIEAGQEVLVVYCDGGNNMAYDAQGKPLAGAVHIAWRDLTNGEYDLEKVVKILKDRPDVTLVPGRWADAEYMPVVLGDSDDPTVYVAMLWKPSQQDYDKAVEYARTNPGRFGQAPRKSLSPNDIGYAALQLDMFGLKAKGAWHPRPEPDDGDDDALDDGDD